MSSFSVPIFLSFNEMSIFDDILRHHHHHRRHRCRCHCSSVSFFLFIMSFIFIHMAIFLLLLLFVIAIVGVVFGGHLTFVRLSRKKTSSFPPNVFFIFGILFPFHAPPIYTPNITLFFGLCCCCCRIVFSPFCFFFTWLPLYQLMLAIRRRMCCKTAILLCFFSTFFVLYPHHHISQMKSEAVPRKHHRKGKYLRKFSLYKTTLLLCDEKRVFLLWKLYSYSFYFFAFHVVNVKKINRFIILPTQKCKRKKKLRCQNRRTVFRIHTKTLFTFHKV